ncbi:MAG: TROVE domain-containing protein [Bacteroidota bacterium]
MKFNRHTTRTKRIKNHEGANAYALVAKQELYTAVVSTTLGGNFYEKADARLARIQGLIRQIAEKDPLFIAKLAVYAREKMYLRSIPLVLTVELAKVHNGDNLLRRATRRVVQRADEITEILAYYQLANKRTGEKKLDKLSKQVQKGLADAFNEFDEYQFAKYNREAAITLRDALFLVHPKAKDEAQQKIFDKIVHETLAIPQTWETQLSAAGQKQYRDPAEKEAAFREKWETMITSGKIGYMALLRNLRNILNANIEVKAFQMAMQKLANPAKVHKSRQFPFRFLAAYRELEKEKGIRVPYILDAIENALEASARNIRGFDYQTRVLIATDVSGSMYQRLSPKSKMELVDVGLVLSALMKRSCLSAITGVFGETYKRVQLSTRGVIANVQMLKSQNVGYSTNGYLAIKDLVKTKTIVDKVLIFTDCQLYNSTAWSRETIEQWWKKYKKMAPDAKLYLFDLAGYGQTPLNVLHDDVYLIAGWSDKIFDVLSAIEEGSSAIREIENVFL